MPEPVAYVFERFPSFGQTFCYREVAELERQGTNILVFSIRRPADEPHEAWDESIVRRVQYLPGEGELVPEVNRALRKRELSPEIIQQVEEWGRQPDFLRLYQAIYIGLRLQRAGGRRIHAHFAGMAARTAYWIGKFFGIPYSFTAHANDIFAPGQFAIGLDRLMAAARAVVAVSDYGSNFLRERFPESSSKIVRIYNGLELSRFSQADFSAGIPSIISIGRLIEKKGFADLINACAILKASGRKFTCDIVGEGPLDAALKSQIESSRMADSVKLVGPQTQEQVAARLIAATVFVLPCTVEQGGGMDNLPTVIMEAMAAGLPVISTPLAGVPEMVENEVTGLLVPARDPSALARAMERIILDSATAKTFGERGLRMAREKFSIETSALALKALFAE